MATSTTNGNPALTVTNSAARLRYFLGQLLTQRDLAAEQQYHVMLRRLLQREVLGTGTVAGLEIKRPTAGTPEAERFVILGAGLAIDPDGRELLVEKDVPIELADPAAVPNTTPFPPSAAESAATLATDIRTRFQLPASVPFTATDVTQLIADLKAAGLIAASDNPGITTLRGHVAKIPTPAPTPTPNPFREFLFDALVGIAHIGLQYREDGADPAPAIVDASCCAGTTCFPSRTQEGVFIAMSDTAFPAIADPHDQLLACLGAPPRNAGVLDCDTFRANLAACIFDMWRPLARVTDSCGDAVLPVVPLATTTWSRYAHAGGQVLLIDNVSERLLALGVPALRAVTDSLAGCLSEDD